MRWATSLIAALALVIALAASAGHRHEQHQASDVGCAVCAVALHSPLVAAVVPLIAPPLDHVDLGVAVVAVVDAAHEHSRESGRAPPLGFAV